MKYSNSLHSWDSTGPSNAYLTHPAQLLSDTSKDEDYKCWEDDQEALRYGMNKLSTGQHDSEGPRVKRAAYEIRWDCKINNLYKRQLK